MTRIDRSPEQLDAEAGRRDLPLNALIALHRSLRKDELHIDRLTADEPPVFVDPNTGERRSDEMSKLGPTLSFRLTAYITGSYGTTFPWARAAFLLRVTCRREHPEHQDRREFRGSLCNRLVNLVVGEGWDPGKASVFLDIDPDRARRTLGHALRTIEAHLDAQRERAERAQREAAGRFSLWESGHEHHAVPGLHSAECPQCRRRVA